MIPNIFQCDYCSATFVTEKGYKSHTCKYKKRYECVTETGSGLSAYKYYLKWLKSSGKSVKYIDEHTFIHSTQYNHFINFISMAKEQGIPDRNIFVRIMAKQGIMPQHWCKDYVISFFLEQYDTTINPIKHIDKSIETILELSRGLECEPRELFKILDNDVMLILIKSRKLSPWLLLNSNEFRNYLINRASAKEREYIQKYINPKKWKKILDKNKRVKNNVKYILKELNL